MDFWSRPKDQQPAVEPQPKRISTPAGQRLSVILENGNAQAAKARDSHRSSVRKSGLSPMIAEAPRESMESSQNSSGYSFNVWSDGEKFAALRNHKQVAKRGGWKRLLIILAIIIACIVALAVGLALGLKKKNSESSNSNNSQAAANPTNPTNPANPNSPSSPSSPSVTSISPSSLPSNFPTGSYSYITFLDTVQTNCTSNPSTWTCYPYTDYNTSPSKSLATFNWQISGSSGSYKISSSDNPFSIEFHNTPLELLDQGKPTERYVFQVSQTRTVSPSGSLTDDNAAVECAFQGTSLQAALYTKMNKSYPDAEAGDPSGNPSSPAWPFAVRVEQAVGGGDNIPSCYKLSNGQPGDAITEGLESQDAGQLCSCLYKNWRTPS